MHELNRISYLISQAVLGRLTEEESRELLQWRKEDTANERFYQEAISPMTVRAGLLALENLDGQDAKQELDRRIGFEQKAKRRDRTWRVWLAAASVLLFIGLGFWRWSLYNGKVPVPVIIQANGEQEQALPAGNRATLVLQNGRKIDLGKVGKGPIETEKNFKLDKVESNLVAYGSGALNFGTNTLVTPRAGQFRIVLSDGTKVWLNNASSLTYPVNFTGSNRTVDLSGQAYFEVAENKSKPFVVRTKGGKTVEVLGTSFDVSAYGDDQFAKTTLVEGKVMVRGGKRPVVLSPGDQAAVDIFSNKVTVKQVDANNITSWRNGFFVYENADLKAIFKEIGRWYDVDLRFDGNVPDIRLSGVISRDNTLQDVIQLMEERHIRCRLENRTLVISQ